MYSVPGTASIAQSLINESVGVNSVVAFTILLFESNPKLPPPVIVPVSMSSKYTSSRNLDIKLHICCPIQFIFYSCTNTYSSFMLVATLGVTDTSALESSALQGMNIQSPAYNLPSSSEFIVIVAYSVVSAERFLI